MKKVKKYYVASPPDGFKKFPNGHWKDWDNCEIELRRLMAENHGLIPTAKKFKLAKLQGMLVALVKYHGGLESARERLGVSNKKVCKHCQGVFDIEEFYLSTKRYADGRIEQYRLNRCRSCNKNLVTAYRNTMKGRSRLIRNAARFRAKKRGFEFSITAEWIEQRFKDCDMCCEATGIRFEWIGQEAGYKSPYSPSLDRIDSSIGYTKENTRLVINWFNWSKASFSDEEFASMVSEFLKKRGDI
jgi:hypothetical protein